MYKPKPKPTDDEVLGGVMRRLIADSQEHGGGWVALRNGEIDVDGHVRVSAEERDVLLRAGADVIDR